MWHDGKVNVQYFQTLSEAKNRFKSLGNRYAKVIWHGTSREDFYASSSWSEWSRTFACPYLGGGSSSSNLPGSYHPPSSNLPGAYHPPSSNLPGAYTPPQSGAIPNTPQGYGYNYPSGQNPSMSPQTSYPGAMHNTPGYGYSYPTGRGMPPQSSAIPNTPQGYGYNYPPGQNPSMPPHNPNPYQTPGAMPYIPPNQGYGANINISVTGPNSGTVKQIIKEVKAAWKNDQCRQLETSLRTYNSVLSAAECGSIVKELWKDNQLNGANILRNYCREPLGALRAEMNKVMWQSEFNKLNW
jgi:hypothetical protein